MLFTIRSERQLVGQPHYPQLAEQIHYNLLFRWFVGLGMDDAVWDLIVFSINRDRLLNTNVAHQSTTTPRARLYKKGEFAEAKLHH